MLQLMALGGLVAVATFSFHRISEHLWSSTPRRRTFATLLDVQTPADAVALVRRLSHADTTCDELADRLEELYFRFPPLAESLQCMSLHEQRLAKTGGEEEYGVCTVYAAMMGAIARLHKERKEAEGKGRVKDFLKEE